MIEEQCNNCRKRGLPICSQKIEFDGSPCERFFENKEMSDSMDHHKTQSFYDKQDSINECGRRLNDNGEWEVETEITADYLKANTTIRGWLSFYLFTIILGGFISAIVPIATLDPLEYANNYYLISSDIVFGLLLFALACYTLYSFKKRKPNAVFLARTYTIAVFVSNVLVLIGSDFENPDFSHFEIGSLRQILQTLVVSVAWLCYLSVSKHVKEIIPIGYRKITSKDKRLVTGLFLIPILLIVIGCFQQTIEMPEQIEIHESSLGVNELTDGRIAFICPEGFTYTKKEESGDFFYELKSEDDNGFTLVSSYETDYSQKNIDAYWEVYEKINADVIPFYVVSNDSGTINNHSYCSKVSKYNVPLSDIDIFWRYVFMYDTETGKFCILSGYDYGDDSYVTETLNSVRFK